jgi:hypothetical protein
VAFFTGRFWREGRVFWNQKIGCQWFVRVKKILAVRFLAFLGRVGHLDFRPKAKSSIKSGANVSAKSGGALAVLFFLKNQG